MTLPSSSNSAASEHHQGVWIRPLSVALPPSPQPHLTPATIVSHLSCRLHLLTGLPTSTLHPTILSPHSSESETFKSVSEVSPFLISFCTVQTLACGLAAALLPPHPQTLPLLRPPHSPLDSGPSRLHLNSAVFPLPPSPLASHSPFLSLGHLHPSPSSSLSHSVFPPECINICYLFSPFFPAHLP